MRANILLLIVAATCVVALLRPRIGLYAYLVFALMRPDYLAFAYGKPYSMAIAVCTLVGSLIYMTDIIKSIWNPFTLLLLSLLAVTFASCVVAEHPEIAYPEYLQFARACVMALLIPALYTTKEQLFPCILIMGLALGAIGAKFGVFALAHGGAQFKNGYGGFMGDNNTFALALVMAIPLIWYGSSMLKTRKYRMVAYVLFFLNCVAIIMTHSRGGILTLGAVLLIIILYSKRRLMTLVVCLVLLAVPAMLVRSTLLPRINTITSYEEDTSAMSRLAFWQAGLHMWRDHPFMGVGFGTLNERLLLPSYLTDTDFGDREMVIHNTYIQMLVDSGIFALLLYLSILLTAITWLLRSIKKIRLRSPGEEACSQALMISLVGFMLGSFFLSRVDFDFVYVLLMCTAAWYRIQRSSASAVALPPASPAANRNVAGTMRGVPVPPVRSALRPSY